MKCNANYSTGLGLGGCSTCDHSKDDTRDFNSPFCSDCVNYTKHSKRKFSRVDIIGRNGNDGCHYCHNEEEEE